ncbi:RluA family pseudouridine synthase, partial [Staphylococcus gallinarum]
MSNHEFVIEQADLSGQRIDKVLPELNSEWSRTQIQDWIKLSLVTVNGKV